MAKLLLNSAGKVLMGNDRVYKAPEEQNLIKIHFDLQPRANQFFYLYDGTDLNGLKYSDTENVTNMYYMFGYCSNLTTIPQLDTSNVTSMEGMFKGCSSLITVPQYNTSNVTTMERMFESCTSLITAPQLDTSNVTKMLYMFQECENLTSVPQYNTSNCTNMSYMFYKCYKLETIDITSLDKVSSTSGMGYFARYCHSLTKVIIRTMTVIPPLDSNSFNNCYHFTGTVNSTYNPEGLKDGRIYVPDNMVDSLKEATNWSEYADIIVPLSTLVEE